jgi:hypothetical protein
MKRLVSTALTLSLLLLAACGTTSAVLPKTSDARQTVVPDLSGYDTVVVLDFADATDKKGIRDKDLAGYTSHVAETAKNFADLIAEKLQKKSAFANVQRQPVEGKALVVSGTITRLQDGNAALRLLVGMGAGSSYFDSTTELRDLETRSVLGQFVTNKNSWVLGGIAAASQNVQSFVNEAAEKIAVEISRLKQPPPVDAAK